jgi:hypothetical protein
MRGFWGGPWLGERQRTGGTTAGRTRPPRWSWCVALRCWMGLTLALALAFALKLNASLWAPEGRALHKVPSLATTYPSNKPHSWLPAGCLPARLKLARL